MAGIKKLLGLLLIASLFSACAISRKVPYSDLNIRLPEINTKSLSIAVWDQREQILKGTRKPDFVGYLRSGAGIAYPMGTLSGNQFADEIAQEISSSFQGKGIKSFVLRTTPEESEQSILDDFRRGNSEKSILLKLNKLHTDGYSGHDLLYDLQVSVYNANVMLVDQKSVKGSKPLGSGSRYKTLHPVGLKKLVEEIFYDPVIFSALNRTETVRNIVSQSEEIKPINTVTNEPNSKTASNDCDIIYLTNGTELRSFVVEITLETIKYKDFNQPNGPIRNVALRDVSMIIYKDGKREVIKK